MRIRYHEVHVQYLQGQLIALVVGERRKIYPTYLTAEMWSELDDTGRAVKERAGVWVGESAEARIDVIERLKGRVASAVKHR